MFFWRTPFFPEERTLARVIRSTLVGASGDGGVRIVDPIPATASFVSAAASQGSCGVVNNTVICNLGMLRDGTQVSATIVLSPAVTGSFTNTATVSANGPDLDTSDNT